MPNKIINSESSFRSKLKNKDFTIIARDCVGGALYHQLKERFLSPTINLFFTLNDFNYFCLYLEDYISGELSESKEENIDYPVGLLKPRKGTTDKAIKVHFMHYETFEMAYQKWEERKQRINWNNIYVISSCCYQHEIENLNDQIINDWNKIKYPKVILVDKQYGFDDEFIINKPEECQEYAWLLYEPDKEKTWKRTFNDFDFIKFLNKK